MTDMVYVGDHNEVAPYLNAHGWNTVSASTSELFVANGLDPVDEHDDDRAPFALALYQRHPDLKPSRLVDRSQIRISFGS
jgi:hypothetical protein